MITAEESSDEPQRPSLNFGPNKAHIQLQYDHEEEMVECMLQLKQQFPTNVRGRLEITLRPVPVDETDNDAAEQEPHRGPFLVDLGPCIPGEDGVEWHEHPDNTTIQAILQQFAALTNVHTVSFKTRKLSDQEVQTRDENKRIVEARLADPELNRRMDEEDGGTPVQLPTLAELQAMQENMVQNRQQAGQRIRPEIFQRMSVPSKEEMESQLRILQGAGLAGGGASSGTQITGLGVTCSFHHDMDGALTVVEGAFR